jgi:4-diphosphocytidyl-2-C-methyl-D-erythritol kinase
MKNFSEKIKQQDNIVYRISDYMLKRFRINSGLQITIKKHIPGGTGLGGGSSDGAETIKAINKLFSLNLKPKQMINIGKKFGADVPFFISGGTALVTGIGDRIKILKPLDRFYTLIIKPSYGISTREVYQKVKKHSKGIKITTDRLSLEKLDEIMENELTEPACQIRPALKKLLNSLQKKLKGRVMMTGSGSAIAVYYLDKKTRDSDQKLLKSSKQYRVFAARSIDPSMEKKRNIFFKTITLGTIVTMLGGAFYRTRSIEPGSNS